MLSRKTINLIEKMRWEKIATREVSLFEVLTAAVAYTRFPLKHKIDSLLIVRKGIATRYGISEQMRQFKREIEKSQMSHIMQKCIRYDKEFNNFLDNRPFNNLSEFIRRYKLSWEGELLGFYIGAFSTDKEAIKLSNKLRGIHNAQHRIAEHYLPKLFKVLIKRFSLKDFPLVRFISPEEILEDKIVVEELKARSKFYAVLTIGNKINLLSGKKIENLINRVIREEEITDVSFVQGSAAYPGKVTGIAKIVNTVADMKKVKRRDVLVSVMTRTNLVSVMEKASAFVTDEGGITCHAAIIARELKKPCLIGTKIATQVLKDGDLIEVDANKGVVKILKKK